MAYRNREIRGRRGPLKIWCNQCKAYHVMPEDRYRGSCPVCGHVFDVMRCTRCGHEWRPRSGSLPIKCADPSCGSRYWNRERREAW